MDLQSISEVIWWWVGGVTDGDGCVTVRTGTLRICVTQASRGNVIVFILQALFGGVIDVLKAKKITHQDTHRWTLEGTAAVLLARKLSTHLFLKAPQFLAASSFPTQHGSVCILQHDVTGQVLEFSSMKECSLYFGCSKNAVANWQKGYRGSHKPPSMQSWTFEFKTRKEAKEKKEEIDTLLRAMKKQEHAQIDSDPPKAYWGGLFDAEGTVTVKAPNSVYASLPQLYPAVLDALKRSYGGTVKWADNKFRWSCGKQSQQFLHDIQPFTAGKLPQMIAALKMPKGGASAVNETLKAYKGQQDDYTQDIVSENLSQALRHATVFGSSEIVSFVSQLA